MGQMTAGILYGVEAPKPLDNLDGEALYDIVEGFNLYAKIDWGKPRIRVEREGGKTLLGVWVAVGGGGDDGVPYFPDCCTRLKLIDDAFDRRASRAKKLWSRFARWLAKKHKIDLPVAELWLTPCEVA